MQAGGPRQPLCAGVAAGRAPGVMEDPGLGSQVSAAWPGGDGGGDPSGGRVRWLREGGGARAWTTLRTMLLVLCCGRGARAAAPAASLRLQGVTHRPLGRLGPGGFQVTHLGRPRQPETLACSLREFC